MYVPEEDLIPPQYLPHEYHDGSIVARLARRDEDTVLSHNQSVYVLDALEVNKPEEIDGASDDTTKLQASQATSTISSLEENFGHSPENSLRFPNLVQAKTMQPSINSPLPTTTSEPAYTPASRSIYRNAVRKLEIIEKWPIICLQGSGIEPPAYMDAWISDRDIQTIRSKRTFECICESVKRLDIEELSAEDYEVSPRFEGGWDTWINCIVDSIMTTAGFPGLSKSVHEHLYNEYRSQIEASAELVEQHVDSLFSEARPPNSQDLEKIRWALDQKSHRYRQHLEENEINLARHHPKKAYGLIRSTVREVMLCVFVKYRVEALLELYPRDYALDNWLRHQMDVCDDWFEENDEHLEHQSGCRKQLRAVWLFSLWQQWESFLMHGFDPVLAEIWEPPLLSVLLVSQPREIQDLYVGAYPQETLLEEGNDGPRPHWLTLPPNFEPGAYENYPIAGYRVDMKLDAINGRLHMVAEAEEGDLFAYIPPPYCESGEKGDMTMKDLASKLILRWDERNDVVTWLNEAIVEGRLDTSTIQWIDHDLQLSEEYEDSGEDYSGEEDSGEEDSGEEESGEEESGEEESGEEESGEEDSGEEDSGDEDSGDEDSEQEED
ncbi:putative nucleoside diphosphate kinase [Venturia nashicola]|nr:putative nucleoside diphosphate kinase [Venturia nashicola]